MIGGSWGYNSDNVIAITKLIPTIMAIGLFILLLPVSGGFVYANPVKSLTQDDPDLGSEFNV